MFDERTDYEPLNQLKPNNLWNQKATPTIFSN